MHISTDTLFYSDSRPKVDTPLNVTSLMDTCDVFARAKFRPGGFPNETLLFLQMLCEGHNNILQVA